MRRRGPVVALVVALVLTAIVGTSSRRAGPPLDPTSTSKDGAKALVTLLDRVGAEVELVEGAPPVAEGGTAILLEDQLDRDGEAALLRWVEAGGRVVVAAAFSSLTEAAAGAVSGPIDRGDCPLATTLGDVVTIDVGDSRRFDAGSRPRCFGDVGSGWAVVVDRRGAGAVISVSGPDLFTNDLLDEADNAALAVALLAPTGAERVYFVQPSVTGVGAGDQSLADLIEDPVRALFFQLVVAFLVLVAWRSRRLGRPIREPLPVEIEASELTRAVGVLLASNRRPARAAALLRDRARRDLAGVLGLSPDASVDDVCRAVSTHTTLSTSEVRAAVADPVTTDEELLSCAVTLSAIRQELLDERSTTRP